jgi:hypothetical protein
MSFAYFLEILETVLPGFSFRLSLDGNGLEVGGTLASALVQRGDSCQIVTLNLRRMRSPSTLSTPVLFSAMVKAVCVLDP